jgi:hypothetical protein
MLLKSMPLYATFWREFYERPTTLYFLVHPEGGFHFRDVVSLIEISRVFPNGVTQLRSCPVNPDKTKIQSPAPGEPIVILGRPEHFRSELLQKWVTTRLFPPLQFRFDSNDPRSPGYRTIRCLLTNRDYSAPDGRGSLGHPQEDYALIYLGQAAIYENDELSPCLILSGTSTLGTWGASMFATSSRLLEGHVGYSPWFQGVLSVGLKLSAPDAPFERSNLTLQVTDSFLRACWLHVRYKMRIPGREPWRGWADFDLYVNGKLVSTTADTWKCLLALAREQQHRPGQFIQTAEITARLRQEFAPPALEKGVLNLPARLQEAGEQLRRHGVYFEKNSAGYRLLLAGFEETIT